MLSILPVIHVGGSKEYDKHPGQVSPCSKDFIPKGTDFYLINYNSNRKNYERAKNTGGRKVFCDSGGLQLGTMGYSPHLNPVDCMRWQQENADFAFVLDDLSPFRLPGDERVEIGSLVSRIAAAGTSPTFIKAAESTARNINQMMKVRDSKVKLFCIIQGFSQEQLTLWHSIVTKEHDLDGFGMKAIGPTGSIENLAWAWENIDKPIHILGSGKIGRTFPLVYWGRKFKHQFTADSTTWYSGAMFKKFYKSMGDLTYGTTGEGATFKASGPSQLACTCQVCEWGQEQMAKGLTQEQYLFSHILSTHNWGMMMDDHRYALVLAEKPDLFREHAETFERFSEEVGTTLPETVSAVDVVDAIDLIHDGQGYEAVMRYCKRTQLAGDFF